MEGSLEAVEVRLNSHEQRLDASHQSISVLRDTSARHDTKIQVIGTELREVRDDLGEIKKTLAETKRALYVTAAFFATFSLSIIGLTATLLNG